MQLVGMPGTDFYGNNPGDSDSKIGNGACVSSETTQVPWHPPLPSALLLGEYTPETGTPLHDPPQPDYLHTLNHHPYARARPATTSGSVTSNHPKGLAHATNNPRDNPKLGPGGHVSAGAPRATTSYGSSSGTTTCPQVPSGMQPPATQGGPNPGARVHPPGPTGMGSTGLRWRDVDSSADATSPSRPTPPHPRVDPAGRAEYGMDASSRADSAIAQPATTEEAIMAQWRAAAEEQLGMLWSVPGRGEGADGLPSSILGGKGAAAGPRGGATHSGSTFGQSSTIARVKRPSVSTGTSFPGTAASRTTGTWPDAPTGRLLRGHIGVGEILAGVGGGVRAGESLSGLAGVSPAEERLLLMLAQQRWQQRMDAQIQSQQSKAQQFASLPRQEAEDRSVGDMELARYRQLQLGQPEMGHTQAWVQQLEAQMGRGRVEAGLFEELHLPSRGPSESLLPLSKPLLSNGIGKDELMLSNITAMPGQALQLPPVPPLLQHGVWLAPWGHSLTARVPGGAPTHDGPAASARAAPVGSQGGGGRIRRAGGGSSGSGQVPSPPPGVMVSAAVPPGGVMSSGAEESRIPGGSAMMAPRVMGSGMDMEMDMGSNMSGGGSSGPLGMQQMCPGGVSQGPGPLSPTETNATATPGALLCRLQLQYASMLSQMQAQQREIRGQLDKQRSMLAQLQEGQMRETGVGAEGGLGEIHDGNPNNNSLNNDKPNESNSKDTANADSGALGAVKAEDHGEGAVNPSASSAGNGEEDGLLSPSSSHSRSEGGVMTDGGSPVEGSGGTAIKGAPAGWADNPLAARIRVMERSAASLQKEADSIERMLERGMDERPRPPFVADGSDNHWLRIVPAVALNIPPPPPPPAVAAQLQRQTLDLREEAELAKRSLMTSLSRTSTCPEEGENSEKLARAFEREILGRMGLTGEIELVAHRLPRARGKAGAPPLLLTFKNPADKISFLRRRKRL
eukprot:jgi/Mesvir1/27372/Mv07180-RA.1